MKSFSHVARWYVVVIVIVVLIVNFYNLINQLIIVIVLGMLTSLPLQKQKL